MGNAIFTLKSQVLMVILSSLYFHNVPLCFGGNEGKGLAWLTLEIRNEEQMASECITISKYLSILYRNFS